jgi:hypothetical protein
MSSSQDLFDFENGWGYRLELEKGATGFLLFIPTPNNQMVKQLKFSPTKFSYDGYHMWVAIAKGRRVAEIVGFFKRYNIPLFSEEEIVEKCSPFTKIYKPRRG